MKKLFFISLFTLIVINGFGQPGSEITFLRNYYFPYKNLIKPVKYVFRNVDDSTETYTWQIQTQIHKKDTSLIIHVTDARHDPVEESINRITKKGALLTSYKTFKRRGDSIVSFQCQVKDSLTFGFSLKQDEQIRWSGQYTSWLIGKEVNIKKTRDFKGFIEPLKAMKFEDKYYFTIEDKEVLDHQVKSYFRKDKGLVRYSVIDNQGISKLFILDE